MGAMQNGTHRRENEGGRKWEKYGLSGDMKQEHKSRPETGGGKNKKRYAFCWGCRLRMNKRSAAAAGRIRPLVMRTAKTNRKGDGLFWFGGGEGETSEKTKRAKPEKCATTLKTTGFKEEKGKCTPRGS